MRRVIYIARKSQADNGNENGNNSSISSSTLNNRPDDSDPQAGAVQSSRIGGGSGDDGGDDYGDCESEMRELSVLLLQTRVYSSFDDMSSAEQVCVCMYLYMPLSLSLCIYTPYTPPLTHPH